MLINYKKIRKPAKCPLCGNIHADGDAVFTVPCPTKNANGGAAYICKAHGTPKKRRYNQTADYIGSLKNDGLTYNIRLAVTAKTGSYPATIDGVTVDSKSNALAYIASVWNGAFIVDSATVLEMPDNTTLSGWRDNLARTLSVLGVKYAPFTVNAVHGLSSDAVDVLSYTADMLSAASAESVIDVFGKHFRKSAKLGTDFTVPTNWAVINGNRIQFNLAYAGSISQYMRGIDFLAGLVKIIQSSKKNKFMAVERLWTKTINHENAVDKRSVYGNKLNRARVEK